MFPDHDLIAAAIAGDELSLVALMEAGANLDEVDVTGQSAAIYASRLNHASCLARLIEGGADLAIPGANGYAAMHMSVSYGSAACLDLLIAAGADIHARSDDGWTPLHEAAYQGAVWAAKKLLNAGADVELVDGNGHAPHLLSRSAELIALLSTELARRASERERESLDGLTRAAPHGPAAGGLRI